MKVGQDDWLCGSTTGREDPESSTCLDETVDEEEEDWQEEVVNLGALLASSWTK